MSKTSSQSIPSMPSPVSFSIYATTFYALTFDLLAPGNIASFCSFPRKLPLWGASGFSCFCFCAGTQLQCRPTPPSFPCEKPTRQHSHTQGTNTQPHTRHHHRDHLLLSLSQRHHLLMLFVCLEPGFSMKLCAPSGIRLLGIVACRVVEGVGVFGIQGEVGRGDVTRVDCAIAVVHNAHCRVGRDNEPKQTVAPANLRTPGAYSDIIVATRALLYEASPELHHTRRCIHKDRAQRAVVGKSIAIVHGCTDAPPALFVIPYKMPVHRIRTVHHSRCPRHRARRHIGDDSRRLPCRVVHRLPGDPQCSRRAMAPPCQAHTARASLHRRPGKADGEADNVAQVAFVGTHVHGVHPVQPVLVLHQGVVADVGRSRDGKLAGRDRDNGRQEAAIGGNPILSAIRTDCHATNKGWRQIDKQTLHGV
mmetsp:Transcript_41708/g.67661  ORF Transcript_41708/g.67661 Transcript_41708/m.67661 type:complete len:420 (-) Transcript_41708:3913-5172(-)